MNEPPTVRRTILPIIQCRPNPYWPIGFVATGNVRLPYSSLEWIRSRAASANFLCALQAALFLFASRPVPFDPLCDLFGLEREHHSNKLSIPTITGRRFAALEYRHCYWRRSLMNIYAFPDDLWDNAVGELTRYPTFTHLCTVEA